MAQFCVEIPDDKVMLVITALASMYKYQAEVNNPNYNPALNQIPEYISNPLYQSQYIPNPSYDPMLVDSENNPESILNPEYDLNQPEMIPNPEYDAVAIAANTPTIANPETIFMFANRMVRQWITENVIAYQAQQAAEEARQNALNSFSLEIVDPQAQ